MLAKARNTGFEDDIGTSSETPVEVSTNSVSTEQAQSSPQRLVYVRPNVPSGALQRFQVFKGGLPPYCEDIIRKIPEIKELFVPLEGLETARRNIEEPGTNEARLFYAVQTALSKGVK
jgi:hypothetical protein